MTKTPVNDEWKDFAAMVYPDGFDDEQQGLEVRKVFFAGAIGVLNILEDTSDEEVEAVIDAMDAELAVFAASLVAPIAATEEE